jgi:alcohol dehydrogenase
MRDCIVFDGNTLKREQCPANVIDEHEVVIQPTLMGICSTDLELMRGYQGFKGILGHEFVGTVIQGPAEWLGQRVVGEINITCGQCDLCRRGSPTHCRYRSVLGIHNAYDGAFASEFHLPIANLHRVPDTLSDEMAVFTEPLAAACQILDQIHLRPSQQVVVIGLGKLGMLIIQVLHQAGMQVCGVVRHDKQRRLLEKWGIPAAQLEDLPLHMADVVVESTGNEAGLSTALELVRPAGTIVLKSTYADITRVNMSRVVVDEIRMVGSRCGPFAVALRWMTDGKIDTTALIEATYPMTAYQEAFRHAAQSGVLKVLMTP